MRILDICEVTKPIASPIRNAYIDFSKMTASLVAVVTDVVRDGRRVVGYGFKLKRSVWARRADPRALPRPGVAGRPRDAAGRDRRQSGPAPHMGRDDGQ